MSSYIVSYDSLLSQLEINGKDAAITETHREPVLLASIDPDRILESTAAALHNTARALAAALKTVQD
eukprot:IDg11068t1